MITYSTEFPIDNKNTVDDVLRLACKWVSGSPHTNIPKERLDRLPTDSEVVISEAQEMIVVGKTVMPDAELGGFRYTCTDKCELEWVTTIVTKKDAVGHLLSIQVTCEALNTTTQLPEPKKPVFIRQALDTLGGGFDGVVPVVNGPIYLDEGHEEVAAKLMLGQADNRLPIIYISITYDGIYFIDPRRLASVVSGLAHVIVEPSRIFSTKLKTLASSRNVYGGTIGVYWPESNARKSYYPSVLTPNSRSILASIAADIRVALANRRQMANCSWLYLRESMSRARYEKLKKDGSAELDEFLEVVESEISVKENRIAEAEQEISRLNAEIKKISTANNVALAGIIGYGGEQDLYEGEIKTFAIEALRYSLRDAHENSRRHHILSDLLAHNNPIEYKDKLKTAVKNIFKSYVEMNAKRRSELSKLGFAISEDGKHYKAVFRGDNRYTFTFPKTSSDHRSGKNTASDISKKLF